MGILSYFYSATSTKVELSNGESHSSAESASVVVIASAEVDAPSSKITPAIINPPKAGRGDKRVSIAVPPSTIVKVKESIEQTKALISPLPDTEPQVKVRRFSFRSLNFSRKDPLEHKPALSAIQEHEKRESVVQASAKRAQKVQQLSRSDKRAKQSALDVRTIIIGPTTLASPRLSNETAKPQLSKIKSQLMQPKSANQLILHLKQLPANGDSLDNRNHKGPIHAVCLEHPDEEEHHLHFAKLTAAGSSRDLSEQSLNFPGVISAPIDAITNVFNEMKLIDLVNSPDFGLGQPGDGKGILAGAVPTAETVIEGIKQITPELMALGYATGRGLTPDHSGMHPPTDRMSILTYWWGLELLLPPPSLAYLSRAQSVSGAVMNFLSAVALVNNGVREILPFIRYIAQFVDFEFSTIKRQDKGDGVVCAATWIMPAALVPRPWDFPPAPKTPSQDEGPDEAQPDRPGVPVGIILPAHPQPMQPMKYSILDTVATPSA